MYLPHREGCADKKIRDLFFGEIRVLLLLRVVGVVFRDRLGVREGKKGGGCVHGAGMHSHRTHTMACLMRRQEMHTVEWECWLILKMRRMCYSVWAHGEPATCRKFEMALSKLPISA